MNLRMAARPPVLLVNMCALLVGFAMFSNILIATQMLQLPTSTGFGAGMSVLKAGLWLMPIGLVSIALAPLAGRAIARFGAARVLLVATSELAAAFAARVPLSHEPWQILGGAILVSVGLAFILAAVPTLIMTMVPISESASATTITALLQSTGTSTASATMAATATIWTVSLGTQIYPALTAFVTMFWLASGTSGCAVVFALLLAIRHQPTRSPA
ncbi:MAG: hypothetical protein H5T78_28715 [Nocardia sp.]|nr:hypothetical protein [Nocardia sp.]